MVLPGQLLPRLHSLNSAIFVFSFPANSSLSTALKIGLPVAGAVIFLLLVMAFYFRCYRKERRQNDSRTEFVNMSDVSLVRSRFLYVMLRYVTLRCVSLLYASLRCVMLYNDLKKHPVKSCCWTLEPVKQGL